MANRKDDTPSVATFADHEVITPPHELRKVLAPVVEGDEDPVGEAATFGFPEVAGVAESLCRLLEHTPDSTRIPIKLVDQHVDAVRAIIREHARPDVAGVSGALTKRLREVTDDFLKRENSFRPDYLENIFSPPLAPSDAGA